jgi:hypothetical protein
MVKNIDNSTRDKKRKEWRYQKTGS